MSQFPLDATGWCLRGWRGMTVRIFMAMIGVIVLMGVVIGITSINRKDAALPATPPIPGIDTNCCRDKINSGIYMVNLLRELKTNNVEIDRWEPGTNWGLSIERSVRNPDRMFIKYTE